MWTDFHTIKDTAADFYLKKVEEKLANYKELAFIVNDPYK